MRAVGLSDLDAATRALLAVPSPARTDLSARLIGDADAADLWRERHGVAHPAGGTGSLCAQAALHPRAPSSQCSPAYCEALSVLLEALATWRARGDHEM